MLITVSTYQSLLNQSLAITSWDEQTATHRALILCAWVKLRRSCCRANPFASLT